MRKFLQKFMSEEDLNKLEEAYKAENAGANGLPTYIPKSRFDEVDGKRKAAEALVANFEADKQKAVDEAMKGIPKDWKEQIDKATKALEDQKTAYEAKLAEQTKTAGIVAKLYEAGARNVKAVQALLDDSKPIDEQITALKASDGYLFGGNTGKGTGKSGGGDDGDGAGSDKKLSEADMYKAVGIAFNK